MRSFIAFSISLASFLVVASSDGVDTSACGDGGGCEAPGPEEVQLLQHKVHVDGQLEDKPGKLDNFKGEQAPEKEKQVLRSSSEHLLKDSGKIRERVPTLADHVTKDPSFEKILLAKQWAHSCYMDGSVKDTFLMNPLTGGTEDCYMNLNALKLPGAMADGSSYRLELIWQLDDSFIVDVVWTQTSSPLESTIRGFTAISPDAANAHNFATGAACAKFNGLAKSPEGACVMDGNGDGDCFFNCVGTLVPWNGEQFIPGPYERKAQGFELYLWRLPHAGADYQLLARQVAGDCLMAAYAKEMFMTNRDDPQANCYMRLDPLMEPGAKADSSSYYFELKWTLDDDSVAHVVWSQTSLVTEPTIQGFQAINAYAMDANGYTGASCAKFNGLGKSTDGQCILDGNGDGDCFFSCAGLVSNWDDGQFIPGPMERKAKKFELYLLMKKPYSYELLAQQTTTDCHLDAADKDRMGTMKDAFFTDTALHPALYNCHIDLRKLGTITYPRADGHSYHFQLEWHIMKGDSTYVSTMLWAQSSSLWEPEIRGFRALDTNAMAAYDYPVPGAGFRGLGRSNSSECMLDGNGNGTGFWNCVGLTVQAPSIPGPMSMQATSVKLYLVRVTQSNVRYTLAAKQVAGCLFEGNHEDSRHLYNEHSRYTYNAGDPYAHCVMDITVQAYSWGWWGSKYRWSVIWVLEDYSLFEVIWEQALVPGCQFATLIGCGPTRQYDRYEAINVNALLAQGGPFCTSFLGIGWAHDDTHCIFNGNGDNECYWNCIGLRHTWPLHPGFIPGPMGMKAHKMYLYMLTQGD